VKIFHYPLSTFHYRVPPPPCLAHFNIGLFTKFFGEFFKVFPTKFFIVMFLILQGFIELITRRLSQYNNSKKTLRNTIIFSKFITDPTQYQVESFHFLKIFWKFSSEKQILSYFRTNCKLEYQLHNLLFV
jgi:hypothetical protein